MRELVFLLKEISARAMLESLLPRLPVQDLHYRFIAFEGKQDLEKQLERRIRGYQNPHVRFLVLRDQDSHPDCLQLKARLLALCKRSGRGSACLIRIACAELETFYLADLHAVETGLGIGNLVARQNHYKFRDPDRLGNPSHALRELTCERYQKVSGSREIGKHLDLGNMRSASFHHLITGIQRLQAELLALPV